MERRQDGHYRLVEGDGVVDWRECRVGDGRKGEEREGGPDRVVNLNVRFSGRPSPILKREDIRVICTSDLTARTS